MKQLLAQQNQQHEIEGEILDTTESYDGMNVNNNILFNTTAGEEIVEETQKTAKYSIHCGSAGA